MRDAIRASWWGRILAEHDTEPTELGGGVLKIGIGCWLLLPWDTFASSPTFRVMTVLPEWLWGLVLAGIGLLHLRALRAGGVRWRWFASLAGFFVWFALSFVFVLTNPPALGWTLFGAAAAGQMWASIRLGAER